MLGESRPQLHTSALQECDEPAYVLDGLQVPSEWSDDTDKSGHAFEMSRYDAMTLAMYSVVALNHVAKQHPEYIIGCDRGGRLFSSSIHMMWHRLHGRKKFPTNDGKINFERISRTCLQAGNDEEGRGADREALLWSRLSNIVAKKGDLHTMGSFRKVLFIEDWVMSGRVRQLLDRLTEPMQVDYSLMTMFRQPDGFEADNITIAHDSLAERKLPTSGIFDTPSALGVDYNNRNMTVECVPNNRFARKNRVLIREACETVAKTTVTLQTCSPDSHFESKTLLLDDTVLSTLYSNE